MTPEHKTQFIHDVALSPGSHKVEPQWIGLVCPEHPTGAGLDRDLSSHRCVVKHEDTLSERGRCHQRTLVPEGAGSVLRVMVPVLTTADQNTQQEVLTQSSQSGSCFNTSTSLHTNMRHGNQIVIILTADWFRSDSSHLLSLAPSPPVSLAELRPQTQAPPSDSEAGGRILLSDWPTPL